MQSPPNMPVLHFDNTPLTPAVLPGMKKKFARNDSTGHFATQPSHNDLPTQGSALSIVTPNKTLSLKKQV